MSTKDAVRAPATATGTATATATGTDAATAGSARPATPPRDPWADNARLLAAVAVVVGHCLIEVVGTWEPAEAVWAASWPFRLSALVLVAGWFTRPGPLTRVGLTRLASSLLVVYVVFEGLALLISWGTTGTVAVDPFVPAYGLWFLLALLYWRIAVGLLGGVRHLALWAVAAALLVGFVSEPDDRFALARAVVWFPVFLLGQWLRTTDVRARLRRRRVQVPATVVAGAAVLVAVIVHRTSGRAPFRVEGSYAGDVTEQLGLVAQRSVLLLAATAGGLALLALVPRRRLPFVTVLGAGSFVIYLLHSLLLPAMRPYGVLDGVDTGGEAALLVLLATAVALALGSPLVVRLARPLIRPLDVLPTRDRPDVRRAP